MSNPNRDSRPERKLSSAPVPEDLRAGLAALVKELGENAAREKVGLSRSAFTRALAGLSVYRGTVAMLRAALGGKARP